MGNKISCSREGTLFYDDESYYSGSIVNNFPHGQGTLYMKDGSKYVGNFVNGLIEGNGVFTLNWTGGTDSLLTITSIGNETGVQPAIRVNMATGVIETAIDGTF